jgi:hypothetical protein
MGERRQNRRRDGICGEDGGGFVGVRRTKQRGDGKNGTSSQRGTNQEAEENSQKEPNLGETLVERRNTTIQSHKGNKQNDDNSLWGKKETKALTGATPTKICRMLT